MTNIGLPMSPGAERAAQAAREREGWQAYTSKQLVDLTARVEAIENRAEAIEERIACLIMALEDRAVLDRRDIDA